MRKYEFSVKKMELLKSKMAQQMRFILNSKFQDSWLNITVLKSVLGKQLQLRLHTVWEDIVLF